MPFWSEYPHHRPPEDHDDDECRRGYKHKKIVQIMGTFVIKNVRLVYL